MNWGLMATAAWDYPSDALEYTTGAVREIARSSSGFPSSETKVGVTHQCPNGTILDALGFQP
jgi:hypothetical protein